MFLHEVQKSYSVFIALRASVKTNLFCENSAQQGLHKKNLNPGAYRHKTFSLAEKRAIAASQFYDWSTRSIRFV
jgi:hypothetical protein